MMHGELSDKTDDKGGINKGKVLYKRNQAQKPKCETELWKGGKKLSQYFAVLCAAANVQ